MMHDVQAIRAYKKVGFKIVKTVNEGVVTWMVRMEK